MDDLLREFLAEASDSLDAVDTELARLAERPGDRTVVAAIFRVIHTIKGTCGFLGLTRLEALAHGAETLLARFRDGDPMTAEAAALVVSAVDRIKATIAEVEARGEEGPGSDDDFLSDLERMAAAPAPDGSGEDRTAHASLDTRPSLLPPGEKGCSGHVGFRPPRTLKSCDAPEANPRPPAAASVRVPGDLLDRLTALASELALTRDRLVEIAGRQGGADLAAPVRRLSEVAAELQDGIRKTRLQPIGEAWRILPRLVRDLGQELGKEIDLRMAGAETEVERPVLDLLKEALIHMVRNSADHGIEAPRERRRAGKPETGTIRLSASRRGADLVVEVGDDGRGLDCDRIRDKVLARGLVTQADLAEMSEAEIAGFIFAPGFSTAQSVTGISGRGVGMDVVKSNIDALGGTIDLISTPGLGTTFRVRIPVTPEAEAAAATVTRADEHAEVPLGRLDRPRATVPGREAKSLLLVDDAAFFRNLLAPVLTSAGFRVVACDSAAAAFAELDAGQSFDAIVTDIEMPGMDGFALAERLKNSPRWRSIPLLALSTLCTPATIARGRRAGFAHVLTKFDRLGLVVAVRQAAERVREMAA